MVRWSEGEVLQVSPGPGRVGAAKQGAHLEDSRTAGHVAARAGTPDEVKQFVQSAATVAIVSTSEAFPGSARGPARPVRGRAYLRPVRRSSSRSSTHTTRPFIPPPSIASTRSPRSARSGFPSSRSTAARCLSKTVEHSRASIVLLVAASARMVSTSSATAISLRMSSSKEHSASP